MKIVYLSKSTIPSRTANSVHVMKMCQALANNNCNVTLYGYSGLEDKKDVYKLYAVKPNFDLVRTKPVFPKKIQPFVHLIKVRHHIKKNNIPKLIYGRDLLTLFSFKYGKVPLVYEAHTFPTSQLNKILQHQLFKSSPFKLLIVISRKLEEKYLKGYPSLLKNKTMVLPDGADPPPHSSFFGENKDRLQIGYVGHLYKGRGIDIVLEIARRLPEHNFHILGGEERDIAFWRKESEELCNVKFHGFVPNYQLPRFYHKFDILLAPYQRKVTIGGSKGETSKWMSPMKIFEYMSYSKCIISSDLEVLREVLINRYNSILVKPDDIEEWVGAINELTKSTDLAERISANAYWDLVNMYTWDIRASRVLNRIHRLK